MSGLIGLYRSGLWRAVAPKQGESQPTKDGWRGKQKRLVAYWSRNNNPMRPLLSAFRMNWIIGIC